MSVTRVLAHMVGALATGSRSIKTVFTMLATLGEQNTSRREGSPDNFSKDILERGKRFEKPARGCKEGE